MGTRQRRIAPTRGLACYQCGSDKVRVTEAQQMKRADGETRLHADVRCKACGHEWYSRHPLALELSRAKDAREAKRHPKRGSLAEHAAHDALAAEVTGLPVPG